MCIIVVKPAGVEFPSEEVFRSCWNTNRDGFGAMWRRADNHIQIDKGYMTLDEVLNWREVNKNLLRGTDVVMHFRIGTHGLNSAGNTHPFPISHNVSDLRSRQFTTTRAIAHNGVLGAYGKVGSSLSDTMIFVKHLSQMSISTFVGSAVSKQYGKFVYMTSTDTIMFGDFNENIGIYYSNLSWKPVTYVRPATTTGGKWQRDSETFRRDKTEESTEGAMAGCDGDCLRCTLKTCVWVAECGLQCEKCVLPSCAHIVQATEYDRWRKESTAVIDPAIISREQQLNAMKQIR